VEWLVTGRIDIGLVYNRSPARRSNSPVASGVVLISANAMGKLGGSPVGRAGSRLPLIMKPPRASRMRIERCSPASASNLESLEIDGIASVLDLVHEGFGYAILPIHALLAHRLARDFVASPIVNPKLTIQLSLVVSAQRPSTPLTRGLLSLARKTALQVLSASKPR
jgi:LysR family nitrogen assimilation transcriptional regulator